MRHNSVRFGDVDRARQARRGRFRSANSDHRLSVAVMAGVAALSSLSSAATVLPRYDILDLGTLGGPRSAAYDINDSGQITGLAYTDATTYHAFLWTSDGMDGPASNPRMKNLGTFVGGTNSTGYGINAGGQITGWGDLTGAVEHAFRYDGGPLIDLGTLGGTNSRGTAINIEGLVTGKASKSGDVAEHAFLWKSGETWGPLSNPQMKDLDTLGGANSVGLDIKDNGDVVGQSETVPGTTATTHAFHHDGSSMADLGTLGGTDSSAYGINAGGQVSEAKVQIHNDNGEISKVSTLVIGAASQFDLDKQKIIITSMPVGTCNGSIYTDVTGMIQSGRNGNTLPLWDGNGIVTSRNFATTGNYTSIGVAKGSEVKPNTVSETALWDGQTITGTDTLVMYTYGGDANLDGKLNIDDYTTVIDANIGNQGPPFPTAGGAEGVTVTAIPEPAMGVGALAAAGLLLRRRRSNHGI